MRVFITGASSGIGAAMAKKFDAMGAQLGLVGRSQEKLDAVLSSMQNAQAHTTYALDVTDRAALFAAARDFDDKAPVDIVLANAGISIGVKTEYEEDLDVLEKVYRTNVFAMAATFHPFIEPMSKRGGGQFAGIGSVGGIRGLPGSEAYCSSKAAVISYLESLRNDVRKYFRHNDLPGLRAHPTRCKEPVQDALHSGAGRIRRARRQGDSRQGFLSCDSLADGLGGSPPEDSSRFRLRLGLKRSRRKATRQRARSLTELPALQPGCPLRRAEFSSAIDPKQRKRDGKETIAVIPPHLQRKAQCRIRHLQSQNFVFEPLQVLEIFRADALTGIDEVQPQRQSSEISGRL